MGAISLFVISACKKDKNTPVPTGTPKIKTAGTASYEYDAQGRVLVNQFTSNDKNVYTYSGSTVKEEQYSGGVVTGTFTHELNSDGYVEKTTYGPLSVSLSRYTYNSAGQLINQHYTNGPLSDSTDSRYFYSPAGRLDSMWYTRNNDAITVFKVYYDYAGSAGSNTISHINSGLLFMGELRNTNPPSKIIYVYGNGTIETQNYSYTYDNFGRIIKSSSAIGTTNYTYY